MEREGLMGLAAASRTSQPFTPLLESASNILISVSLVVRWWLRSSPGWTDGLGRLGSHAFSRYRNVRYLLNDALALFLINNSCH